MASIKAKSRTKMVPDKRTGEKRPVEVTYYRARYRDDAGKEHARHFDRKGDAQRWLDEQTAALVKGTHVAPRTARTTVSEWCDTWMLGYGGYRKNSVRGARWQIKRIKAAPFASAPLGMVRPSQVKAWVASLKAEGLAPSTVYLLHRRLATVYNAAVEDGIVPRSPCSRKTSPGAGEQRPHIATTEQVWALCAAMRDDLRPAILLAAFAGLRAGEACGLRVIDVDYMRGVVSPEVQFPEEPLKTECSRASIPIPREMALDLAAALKARPGPWVMNSDTGGQLAPWTLEREFRAARAKVAGLPEGYHFHDLRHYFASLLIASGNDVKVVQARLRHKYAKTTLDTYGHLWPDSDETTRTAVAEVFKARDEVPADDLRTEDGSEE